MEIILRKDLHFQPQAISAWAYLLFVEKNQDPEETLNTRAMGTRLAQGWLFSQAYKLNDEPLDEMKLTELKLTFREANRLIIPLSQISAEVDILDDAETVGESAHLKVKGNEYKVKPIPWEACDRWITDIKVSLAQAYLNMIRTYITRNGEKITKEMMSDASVFGIEEGKVLFELVKYQVN